MRKEASMRDFANGFSCCLALGMIVLTGMTAMVFPPLAWADDGNGPEGAIVAVGNSLTEGLGVGPHEAYPARLEAKLRKAGYDYKVVNAGVSGETSGGLKSRVEWVLKLKPDIVVVCTGANDGLRGLDPALTEKNLHAIVEAFSDYGAVVVLAGMRMVGNMGEAYTEAFEKIYPSVARKHSVLFMPFLLKDVAGEPGLNQEDAIHPNARGYEIVAENVYPYVLKAIERHRSSKS